MPDFSYAGSAVIDTLRMTVLHPDGAIMLLKLVDSDGNFIKILAALDFFFLLSYPIPRIRFTNF